MVEKSSGVSGKVPYGKPSDKLTKIKTANPFADVKQKQKTNFAYAYTTGAIPCRINHGSVSNKLQWDIHVEQIEAYDPLLVNCFEGLLETDHPYNFLAFESLKQLLDSPTAPQKTIPILQKLVTPVRAALCSKDECIQRNGISAVRMLAIVCKVELVKHLNILLAQLNSKLNTKSMREQVMECLNVIEQCCGPESTKLIKHKIPTYTSII